MAGLMDQADGGIRRAAEGLEHARAAWQESMLRPIDELRLSLRTVDPSWLAARASCSFDGESLGLRYWSDQVRIAWPSLEATLVENGQPCFTFDQAMLLYYLRSADGAPMADAWIGYRELPDGVFYQKAFQGYSGDRLARAFGADPAGFASASTALGGESVSDLGSTAFAFQPLPMIRLAAILWPGDEEFAARAAILFDAASSHYMTTDGLALLGSGLVGRLLRSRPSAPGPSGGPPPQPR